MSQHSGKVTGSRLDIVGSVPDRSRDFCLLEDLHTGCSTHPEDIGFKKATA
jgi:hypothetical protein